MQILWGVLLSLFCISARAELQTFESQLRTQPSQNFYNFEAMDEALKEGGYKYDPFEHTGTNVQILPKGDLTGMCIFHSKKKSPFYKPGDKEEEDVKPSSYFKKYMEVKSPEDMLKECATIPDDFCENGVALMGHATLMMGTGGLLYLDPYQTRLADDNNRSRKRFKSLFNVTKKLDEKTEEKKDEPVFFPPEKKTREELVACFKRISKGIRELTIPLTFSSCTLPYAEEGEESAKRWDRYAQLLAQELGILIRTARGSNYTGCNTVYCYAEYGFNWVYPNGDIFCEDGKNCHWVSPPNRPRTRTTSHIRR